MKLMIFISPPQRGQVRGAVAEWPSGACHGYVLRRFDVLFWRQNSNNMLPFWRQDVIFDCISKRHYTCIVKDSQHVSI